MEGVKNETGGRSKTGRICWTPDRVGQPEGPNRQPAGEHFLIETDRVQTDRVDTYY